MRSYAFRFGVLVAILLGIAAPHALAQPLQGTIFYQHAEVLTTWTMDADGSDQTELGYLSGGAVSNLQHAGYFWFVDARPIADEFYPCGHQRVELFAFRSDFDAILNNNPATNVQLTDDFALQPLAGGIPNVVHWVPGDNEISFKGRRWLDDVIVEGGIYRVSLEYDLDGHLVGGGESPMSPDLSFPLVLDGNGELTPAVRMFHWAPTALKLVYTDWAHKLWVADLVPGTQTLIYNAIAQYPQWSLDGAKIAFSGGGNVYTINPNGTQLKKIIKSTSTTNFSKPYWSPNTGYVVCFGTTQSPPWDNDLYRAKSNGTSLTNLTSTPDESEAPWGWR